MDVYTCIYLGLPESLRGISLSFGAIELRNGEPVECGKGISWTRGFGHAMEGPRSAGDEMELLIC